MKKALPAGVPSGVIAEIGINHNGDIAVAKEMVQVAADCGADFVKIQKRNIDACYTEEELARPCKSPWGETVEAKVRGRELSWDEVGEFAEAAIACGVGWACSCFDLNSLVELNSRFPSMSFHKVPSAMSKHDEFLRHVASFGRTTVISVGLAEDINEVRHVAGIFEDNAVPYVLNVTTSLYPTAPERCNVNRIQEFKKNFGSYFAHCYGFGYSGHETGLLPSIVAKVLGADLIERHFTLDRSWYGADQAASLEPEGLSRLCRDVAEVPQVLGSSEVHLFGDEKNPVPRLFG